MRLDSFEGWGEEGGNWEVEPSLEKFLKHTGVGVKGNIPALN